MVSFKSSHKDPNLLEKAPIKEEVCLTLSSELAGIGFIKLIRIAKHTTNWCGWPKRARKQKSGLGNAMIWGLGSKTMTLYI